MIKVSQTFLSSSAGAFAMSPAHAKVHSFPINSMGQFVYAMVKRLGSGPMSIFTKTYLGDTYNYLTAAGPCQYGDTGSNQIHGNPFVDTVWNTLDISCTWNDGAAATCHVEIDRQYGDCNANYWTSQVDGLPSHATVPAFSSSYTNQPLYSIWDWAGIHPPSITYYSMDGWTCPGYGWEAHRLGFTVPQPSGGGGALVNADYAPTCTISDGGLTATLGMSDYKVFKPYGDDPEGYHGGYMYIGFSATITLGSPSALDEYEFMLKSLLPMVSLNDDKIFPTRSYANYHGGNPDLKLRFPGITELGYECTNCIGIQFDRSGSTAISGSTSVDTSCSFNDGHVSFQDIQFWVNPYSPAGISCPFWSWVSPNYTEGSARANSWAMSPVYPYAPTYPWDSARSIIASKSTIQSLPGIQSSSFNDYHANSGTWTTTTGSNYLSGTLRNSFDPMGTTSGYTGCTVQPVDSPPIGRYFVGVY